MSVEGASFRYRYVVDGRAEVVRGMGYNPRVADLSVEDRRLNLRRDFALMRASAVNTVIGWDPAAFDGLTLDVAAEQGLGILMPYDVDFGADFREPAVARAFQHEVLDWVNRYRSHPAARMWGIGNEVFHRIVPPVWCSTPPTPEAAERARAFAAALVDTADQAHSLDPDHPIVYRDAEDAHIRWLAEALRANPRPRPWFVYGVNAYTSRLAEILRQWPDRGVDMAVLVSEFGALGATRGERAMPIRELWLAVRSQPEYVLGGAIYVWYADGPEPVDYDFGLVDAAGNAVDDALAALASLYAAEAATPTDDDAD